jgi:Fic family protein
VSRISALEPVLQPETRPLAAEAAQEIARFNAEQTPAIGPPTAVLLRSEAASSSQIENLSSGARAIAVAALGEQAGINAELINANVRAMEAAIGLSDRLDEKAIQLMQQALLGVSQPWSVGNWRQQQVWIGGTGLGPHQAMFVPPHHSRLSEAMADLVAFIQRDDLPVITQAAIAHAQFETIHPFPDGNGRTGRALLHAMLRAKGLTRHVTVPVSAGLLAGTGTYFTALASYQAGQPDVIVRVVAEAAFNALANARILAGEQRAFVEAWNDRLAVRRDALAWRVLASLPAQPVINAAHVQREFAATSAAAHCALRQLEAAGVITEFTGRQRSRLWEAREITALLEGFAARAAQRGRAVP